MACHHCGQIQDLPPLAPGMAAACATCGGTLLRRVDNSLDRVVACYLGAAILFAVANLFPFMSLAIEGRAQSMTIPGGAVALYHAGMWPVALVVLAVGTLLPLLKIVLMLSVLLPLRLEKEVGWLKDAFRWVDRLQPWSMMEVYLLGVIVAYVKLSDLATVELGTALYAFVALILVLALGDASLETHLVWRRLGPQARAGILRPQPATRLLSCHDCDQLVRTSLDAAHPICPRCHAALHARKPESLARTWALVITAAILYLPANLYPVMTVVSLGRGEPDTILSGVVALLHAGMLPVALLVFVASILVPVLKLLGLAFLLVSVQRRWSWRPRARTSAFRVIEAVGRWSMVDVFMIAILTALVSLGNIATIEPGVGSVSFAAVVIITMLASMSFDPRLIWDALDERDGQASPARA